MKVLIIENEIYLAQSIAGKLSDMNYECEIVQKSKDMLKTANVDIILLSTSIPENDIYEIIAHFKNSIIILLVSYINNDTTTNPIEAGACDYIQKPFMFEELVRKIKHYEEVRRLKQMSQTYKKYLNNFFEGKFSKKNRPNKLTLPLIIKTNNEQYADGYVFFLSNSYNFIYTYIRLDKNFDIERFIKNYRSSDLFYLSNFDAIPQAQRQKLLNFAKNKRIIIQTLQVDEKFNIDTISLISSNINEFFKDNLLSIDDYLKFAIINYQKLFSDTELSQRLGISRKSLWEKRKKYEIKRKK